MAQNKSELEDDLEENLDDTEITLSEPFNPKDVDIQVKTSIMDSIIKRLGNGEIELVPDFQRSSDLWSKGAQSRLIESLLINIPIPAFYFDAGNEESWEIVDGLQRLSTIKNFVIDKSLRLTGLEFLKEYDGFAFTELPRTLQRRIEEAPVTLYLIRPGTPTKMKYSLFNRINTGGLSLKPQEIRHAISQGLNKGRASKFLKKLSESTEFTKVVSSHGERMSNSELILRHLTFAVRGLDEYKSSMVKFLDDGMEILGEMSEKELINYEERFKRSMRVAWNLFEQHAFKKSFSEEMRIKVINKPLFESLSVALSKLTENQCKKLNKNKTVFLTSFKTLMENEHFGIAITKSTANTEYVRLRFEEVDRLVRKYSKD